MNRLAPRLTSWLLALGAASLTLGGAGALGLGCGDSTGQDHVSFAVQVGGFAHPAGPVQTTTRAGWTITFTRADVALGPVYLNTLAPLACDTCSARATVRRRFEDFFVPRAWAHGESHLGAGLVVGQVTRQVRVDALSSEVRAIDGGGDGIDLEVRSAEVWRYNLDGAVIRVAGTASRTVDGANVEVPFEGSLVADESITTAQAPLDVARRVRGIPAALTLSEGGTLTVRVDPRGWFEGADFRELTTHAPTVRNTFAFSPADNVGRAFLNNARASRGVYSFAFAAASSR